MPLVSNCSPGSGGECIGHKARNIQASQDIQHQGLSLMEVSQDWWSQQSVAIEDALNAQHSFPLPSGLQVQWGRKLGPLGPPVWHTPFLGAGRGLQLGQGNAFHHWAHPLQYTPSPLSKVKPHAKAMWSLK